MVKKTSEPTRAAPRSTVRVNPNRPAPKRRPGRPLPTRKPGRPPVKGRND